MAEVLPFVATRFAPKFNSDLSAMVTPPYDVIDHKFQQELYEANPHNIVRVDFGKDLPSDNEYENRYSRAGAVWQEWKKNGVIVEEPKKAFYVYEQEFRLESGEMIRRRGFFAAVKIEDFSQGGIRAHEHTFDGPKADRFRLMRATNSNLSPIFCLFDDPQKQIDALLEEGIADQKPVEAQFQGITQRLWVLNKQNIISEIAKLMADKTLFIADGHHRYETSLLFRNEMRDTLRQKNGRQPFDYTLMYLNNIHDEGLVILPTHRILSKETIHGVDMQEALEDLKEYFEIEEIPIQCDRIEEEAVRITGILAQAGERAMSFMMLLPKCKAYLLKLRPQTNLNDLIDDEATADPIKQLDVTVLHKYIINQALLGNPEIELDDQDVHYVKDAAGALRAMTTCKYGVGLMVNPTKIEQVLEIAREGLRMPHKSTYFYPKLVTGLVMRDLNSPW